jgi:hypothetical protein
MFHGWDPNSQQELAHRETLREKAKIFESHRIEVFYYDDDDYRFYYAKFEDEEHAAIFKLTHM